MRESRARKCQCQHECAERNRNDPLHRSPLPPRPRWHQVETATFHPKDQDRQQLAESIKRQGEKEAAPLITRDASLQTRDAVHALVTPWTLSSGRASASHDADSANGRARRDDRRPAHPHGSSALRSLRTAITARLRPARAIEGAARILSVPPGAPEAPERRLRARGTSSSARGVMTQALPDLRPVECRRTPRRTARTVESRTATIRRWGAVQRIIGARPGSATA